MPAATRSTPAHFGPEPIDDGGRSGFRVRAVTRLSIEQLYRGVAIYLPNRHPGGKQQGDRCLSPPPRLANAFSSEVAQGLLPSHTGLCLASSARGISTMSARLWDQRTSPPASNTMIPYSG